MRTTISVLAYDNRCGLSAVSQPSGTLEKIRSCTQCGIYDLLDHTS